MSGVRKKINHHEAVFKPRTKRDDNDELSLATIIAARRTGMLNLSSRGLCTVPERLWTVNELTEKELTELRFELAYEHEEERWWEQELLKSLNLSFNNIILIESNIERLSELEALNLSNNSLQELPSEIGRLRKLRTLNVSNNKLEKLPDELYNLFELRELYLSNNLIKEVNPKIGDIVMLNHLDLSRNDISLLPVGMGYLVRLTTLDMSHNKLEELPPDIMSMRELRKLDASFNLLEILPELGEMRKVEILQFQTNNLSKFPAVNGCTALKELYLANNNITEIDSSSIEGLTQLRKLNLSNNKIASIPEETVQMINLEFFDVSHNSISMIPNFIGLMPNLKNFSVEGNTIKNVRPDIIRCGTSRILKHIRQSMKDTDNLTRKKGLVTDVAVNVLSDKYTMKNTRLLSFTGQDMSYVPKEFVENAKAAQVTTIDVSRNKLCHLPEELSTIDTTIELRLTSNRFTDLPQWIGEKYKHLETLDLSKNILQSLPSAISSLHYLKELDISFNRYVELPECIYDLQNLTILLANDNKIQNIDVCHLRKLRRLATLNLSNNNIAYVPPELGDLRNIRTLLLSGNCFKQPRQAILMRNTDEILAYLRDRIPQ